MGRNIKDKKMIKIIVSIIILLALLVAILGKALQNNQIKKK